MDRQVLVSAGDLQRMIVFARTSSVPLSSSDRAWLDGADRRLREALDSALPPLPPRGPDGFREVECGACGKTFGTNFRTEEIECAWCEARRCPCCGSWFGGGG